MNSLPAIRSQELRPLNWSGQQLAVIRRMWAKDANDDEFNTFVDLCKELRLNPARKQMHCVIFNKDKPDKRTMVPMVGIDGLRTIATRCGDYRPDGEPPEIVFDEKEVDPKTNPKGIVSATVRCYKRDPQSGDWHPVAGIAHWDAFAPLKEIWEYSQEQGKRLPTGQYELDQSNDFWRRKPELMLAKCAESQALRRGWPEDLSGVYAPEEFDSHGEIIEGTATEVISAEETARRIARVNAGKEKIAVLWAYSMPVEFVEIGKLADACVEKIQGWDAAEIDWFKRSNKDVLQRFWASHKSDALGINQAIEKRLQALREQDEEVAEKEREPAVGSGQGGASDAPTQQAAPEMTWGETVLS